MTSHLSQRGVLLDENPSLTDQDVGLLYEIITRAERDPDVGRLPFRALFAAYDAVLADHGPDADPEQNCMRFLFKMGNNNNGGAMRGESIFERFEELLQQMGIVLELDDQSGTRGITPDDTQAGSTGELEADGSQSRTGQYGHVSQGGGTNTHQSFSRRRASFNSMYDVGEDATQRSLANRPSSRSSMSRLQVGKPKFHVHEKSTSRQNEPISSDEVQSSDRSRLLAQFLDIGRKLMGGLDPAAADTSPSTADKRHLNGDKNPIVQEESVVINGYSGSSSSTDSVPSSPTTSQKSAHPATQSRRGDGVPFNELEQLKMDGMLSQPNLSNLLREASAFSMYRRRETARRLFDRWVAKTGRLQQNRDDMYAIAINRDRMTLLRQAFELWRSKSQQKKQAARTERFFKHLERRAERARDLYLMTKAFTHWAQLTTEERAKNSAARQHVLRVKYFKAWRQITAVNELKAQRFAMTRPFEIWREKTSRIQRQEALADAFYIACLKKRFYWKWFWSFCDRRAPQWYDWCLKRRSLIYWLRKIRTQKECEQEVDQRKRRNALESTLQLWLQKSRAVASAQRDADSMYRTKLLRIDLDEWRIKGRLSPAAAQVTYKREKRIAREAFSQWISRARAVLQAVEVDRLRMMRNAWTAWNDCLRCQVLQARIDERLKKEVIYKWVVNERCHLMIRVREQRALQDTFQRLKTHTLGKLTLLAQREQAFMDYRKQKLLRSNLSRWRDQLSIQQQRAFVALEFYAPRVIQEAFGAWNSLHQHVKRLEKRAEDARFYFLTTKTIRSWRAATVEAAKRRRKAAYATVRVNMKIHLARNALDCWVNKTRALSEREDQAAEFFSRKSKRLMRDAFQKWRTRNFTVYQSWHDSEIYYDRQLAYQQLTRWNEVFKSYRNLEQQAQALDLLHVSGFAAAQLRKLSLRIFQIRSSFETADAMNERLLKKHFRSMFYHWLQRVRRQRDIQTISCPEVESPTPPIDRVPHTPASAVLADSEPLLSFSELLSTAHRPSTTPAATPGYLTSPSKRAARARMLAQMTTTPATPLYTPFAVRLRAARTPERPPTLPNDSTRRRSLGTTVRFADDDDEDGDVEEQSPSTGRLSLSRD